MTYIKTLKIFVLVCILAVLVTAIIPTKIFAGRLSAISDTLSTSAPNIASDHTIRFATTSDIPASGKIIFTPASGAFNIPASLNYTDVDIAINLADKPVAAVPGSGSGSNFGVSVITGTSGSITITLNDTDQINDGDTVSITIGLSAVVGSAGDQQITNPGSIGSYNETITTKNASNTTIDSSTIQVAIVNPVGIDADAPSGSVANPIITPNGGSFVSSTSVTISTATSGATIYYTTDGTLPTTSSTIYTGAFTVSSTLTVQTYAVKSGLGDSGFVSASFTITSPPPPPPPPVSPPASGGGGGGGGGGNPGLPTPPPTQIAPPAAPNPSANCSALKADLNCDTRVNLTDLSILLYNWGTVKNNQRADINKDNKVNLVDFSILLYEWTDK